MTRPQLDVAEVIRSCYDEFLEEYGAGLTPAQRRALDDLTACRTAALGGHVLGCPECGYQEISYNSCGNRHCPKCYGTASARGSRRRRPTSWRCPTSTSSSRSRGRRTPSLWPTLAKPTAC